MIEDDTTMEQQHEKAVDEEEEEIQAKRQSSLFLDYGDDLLSPNGEYELDMLSGEEATPRGKNTFSATLTSSSSRLGDDSTELDEMLQQEHIQSGLCAPIERLPLILKLILMMFISVVGLVILGALLIEREANSMKENRQVAKSSSVITNTGDLIHQIQMERSAGLLFLSQLETASPIEYNFQIRFTDQEINSFYDSLVSRKGFGSIYNEKIEYVQVMRTSLADIRSQILARGATIDSSIAAYAAVTTDLIQFITKFISQSSDSHVTTLNVLLRFKEALSTLSSYFGAQLNMQVMSENAIVQFTSYIGEARGLRNMLASILTEEELFAFYKIFPQVNDPVEQLQNAIIEDGISASVETWQLISQIRLEKLRDLQNEISSAISSASRAKLNRSITRVTIIIILITVFWIANFVSAVIFSKTITGPWERLLHTQKLTMKKFVPKHLLKILKCNKLADLTAGKTVNKELAVMYVDIRNFLKVSDTMVHADSFLLYNRYLNTIAPAIHEHGGHIDKFVGHKVEAVFPSYGSSLRSSLEIHRRMKRLNAELSTEKLPSLHVSIGVNTGKVSVGTVQVKDKIEGIIASEAVLVAQRLQSLAKVLGVKVLTTKEALNKVSGEKIFATRPLGYARIPGKARVAKLYEVFDSDDAKVITSGEFKEAVRHLNEHSHQLCIDILQKIIREHPEDTAAARVLATCVDDNRVFEEKIRSVKVIHDIIYTNNMWDDFHQFCVVEKSEENFECWTAITKWQSGASISEKITQAKRIYNTFLSEDAPRKVNTNSHQADQIMNSVNECEQNGTSPDSKLFYKLQTEMENLMMDTFARYKRTDQFREVIKKSLTRPVLKVVDEETM